MISGYIIVWFFVFALTILVIKNKGYKGIKKSGVFAGNQAISIGRKMPFTLLCFLTITSTGSSDASTLISEQPTYLQGAFFPKQLLQGVAPVYCDDSVKDVNKKIKIKIFFFIKPILCC